MLLHTQTHTHIQCIQVLLASADRMLLHSLTRAPTPTHARIYTHSFNLYILEPAAQILLHSLTRAHTYPSHPCAHTHTNIQFIHIGFARQGCVHTNSRFFFHFLSLEFTQDHLHLHRGAHSKHLHQHTIYIAHSCIGTPPPKTEVLPPNAPRGCPPII